MFSFTTRRSVRRYEATSSLASPQAATHSPTLPNPEGCIRWQMYLLFSNCSNRTPRHTSGEGRHLHAFMVYITTSIPPKCDAINPHPTSKIRLRERAASCAPSLSQWISEYLTLLFIYHACSWPSSRPCPFCTRYSGTRR